ncbi:unnamed protein product [Malus baccata var. baccata]
MSLSASSSSLGQGGSSSFSKPDLISDRTREYVHSLLVECKDYPLAMKYSRSLLFGVLLLIGFALTNSKAANTDPPVHCESLNRSSFEPMFIFGTGSASYQYEGALKEDGRGPSIWDTYTHKYPERIADGSNGDIAIDQYHRYKIGLKPFVTLFHWDVPQALEDEYGGFLSPRIVSSYCEFGDRVKHWFTVNEPYTFSNMGYAVGAHALGRCSSWQNLNCTGGDSAIEPYLVTHHILLAHGAAVELYKNRYQATQKGLIGITLVSDWFEPALNSKQDKDAALRSLDFMFLDPLTSGDYPHTMRSIVGKRLPKFTKEQSKLLNGSFDFRGTIHYRQATPITVLDWLYVYPKGIHDLVLYTKEKYNDPLIYITENGASELNNRKLSLEEALHDTSRIDYYYRHLCYLQAVIKNGAKVKGYFPWTLLDDFE